MAKRRSCWYCLYAVGLDRSDQAMPCGWLMLYRSAGELGKTCFRGDKTSVGKVGARCEEAEVQRRESLAPDRNV